MDYEDRIALWTPEGIEINYALAGIASRYIAAAIDMAIKFAVWVAAVLVVVAVTGDRPLRGVVVLMGLFLLLFVYDVVFEVWGAGRSPGKRLSGLRVVRETGQPVDLPASAVRRLLWLIDGPLTAFIAGTIAMLVTARNQRLGDLAAGTIVVREERSRIAAVQSTPVTRAAPAAGIDVTAISPTELAAVRDFLARRGALGADARARVAGRLAKALAPKVGGLPPGGLAPEQLLETIAAKKG